MQYKEIINNLSDTRNLGNSTIIPCQGAYPVAFSFKFTLSAQQNNYTPYYRSCDVLSLTNVASTTSGSWIGNLPRSISVSSIHKDNICCIWLDEDELLSKIKGDAISYLYNAAYRLAHLLCLLGVIQDNTEVIAFMINPKEIRELSIYFENGSHEKPQKDCLPWLFESDDSNNDKDKNEEDIECIDLSPLHDDGKISDENIVELLLHPVYSRLSVNDKKAFKYVKALGSSIIERWVIDDKEYLPEAAEIAYEAYKNYSAVKDSI